jgi:pimeloyl-ACP methyl ester carboxylesterase
MVVRSVLQDADADQPTATVERRPGGLELAGCVGGLALAVLVGIDGSPGWQLARVIVVVVLTAAVVSLQLRTSARRRGRISVVVGIPALAIAVGFSPHLVERGLSVVGLASIALAVASIGLIVAGTLVATGGRRRVRRGAAGAVVFVAAALALLVVGPAVAATNVPRPDIGATPASVGLHYERVSLRTRDDVALAAWYIPGDSRAAVVLLHGAGSTRSNVLDAAAVLADAGFGVVMIDARGHGESEGRAMDFGWHGDADIAAATAYLSTRTDIDRDRIGVVGLSMGGEEAIGASGSDPLIRAVVAEGATARGAGDEAWLSDVYGWRGLLQEQLERVQDWVIDPLTSASPPASMRSSVAASRGTRYLLIAAGDVADEQHAAAFIAGAAPDRVETWTVDGAGHTGGLRTAPGEWTSRVTTFLRDALLTCSSSETNLRLRHSGDRLLGSVANERENLDVLGGVVLHELHEERPQRGVAHLLQHLGELLEFLGVSPLGRE